LTFPQKIQSLLCPSLGVLLLPVALYLRLIPTIAVCYSTFSSSFFEDDFTTSDEFLFHAFVVRTDGLHISIAAVYNLDMIISMNFQHIVKRKTKIGTAYINALYGYRPVEIYTPMEVVEDESQ